MKKSFYYSVIETNFGYVKRFDVINDEFLVTTFVDDAELYYNSEDPEELAKLICKKPKITFAKVLPLTITYEHTD